MKGQGGVYPSLADLIRASFLPGLLQFGEPDTLHPDHLQSTIIVNEAMVVLPEILYHVTTDLVLHCAKPDKPEILSPSGILREGNFNWRALITGHIYDLSRLCFVERAVWGGAEIDLNDFGRASGYIYTPGRAKRLHELVTQFRDISTGTLAPEDNLREILTEIGIRPDSPWGKIILDHSPRGQAFRQAWFPSEFYLELHLRRMRERYDRLDEESQRRLQEASPIVFAFRRPNPPLTFIYPPLFLKQYGKLIDGAERDPRRVLPAPKGVTKEQLTAIICRESDREKIIRLAQEKEVKAEVIGIEQYLEQAPERAIDFCERRYQSTAEHAPFTHHTLLQWIREGSCVPLVGGREGMKIGVYSPSEFLEFKQELQSNPFSFLGR